MTRPKPYIVAVIYLYLFLFFRTLWAGGIFSDNYVYFKSADIYWLLKLGEWIINTGTVPHFNVLAGTFSELQHLPWVCYQWLSSVILAVGYKLAGIHGLIYIYSVLYLLVISILGSMSYFRGFRLFPETALSVGVSSVFLLSVIDLRPGIFSVIGMAFLLIIFHFMENKKFVWGILPVLFLLWSNLHIGFVVGIFYTAVEMIILAVSKKTLRPLGIFFLCFFVTTINPYGLYLYKYLFKLGNSPFMNSNIQELKHFNPIDNPIMAFYLALLLICYIVSLNSNKIRLSEKILFPAAFAASMFSVRHVSVLLVFIPLFYSAAMEKLLDSSFKDISFLKNRQEQKFNIILYFLICVFAGFVLCAGKIYPVPKIPRYLTPDFINYINKTNLDSPVLTSGDIGSELLYFTKAYSYLDTRFDMYGDSYVKKYHDMHSFEGNWAEDLKKTNVKYVLYDSSISYEGETSLFTFIKTQLKPYGWKVLYEDKKILFLANI